MRVAMGWIAVSTVALAGCGEDQVDRNGDDARTASGEVRGGTISDAMLPLDTVQSQSPPLRSETPDARDNGDDDGAEPAAEADEAEPSAEVGAPTEVQPEANQS